MKKKHPQPLTPAALYAKVYSDRQDVDLSVSAQPGGVQGVCEGQRLLRGPRVHERGRERPRRRPAPVQGDDRGGQQTQGPLRGHPHQ